MININHRYHFPGTEENGDGLMFDIEKIKESANKLYTELDDAAGATVEEMREKSELDKQHFLASIGWLLSQNKIRKDGENIIPAEDADEEEILVNVERVVRALNIKGTMSVDDLEDEAGLEVDELWIALGWLVGRDKVVVTEENLVKLTLPESP